MIRIRHTYRSCSEMPIFNFIKLLVHDDINYVYSEKLKPWIKNDPKAAEYWDNIFSEYSSIAQNSTFQVVFSLHKEITYLSNKIYLVQNIVNYLMDHDSEDMVGLLKSQGFRYSFSKETKSNDIRLTLATLKNHVLRLNQAKDELKAEQTTGKSTEQDYTELLTELSKYQGSRLDPKKITVAEFAAILTRFKRDNTPKSSKNG